MVNAIALTLEKEKFGNGRKKNNQKSFLKDVKKIASESFFFFSFFLILVSALQLLPVASGLIKDMNIGINEVVVSFVGFVNVFFFQLYNKKLKAKK